ncbi:hypothetical protein VPH35_042570 [Triticum aestivum]
MKLFNVLFSYVLLLVLVLYTPASLSDSPPLQDVCPMAPQSERKLTIQAYDFKTLLLNHAGKLDNMVRSLANIVTAAEFPGLNTLGMASEMMFVHDGSVLAGFLDSTGKLFQKRLCEGDVFIFPRGLVHFIMNYGLRLATTFSMLNSQNPGVVGITHAMFSSDFDVVEGLMGRMMKFREMEIPGNNTADFPWTY